MSENLGNFSPKVSETFYHTMQPFSTHGIKNIDRHKLHKGR